MVGTGAGVGIQQKYVDNLPSFRTDISLFHEKWEFTPKSFREDITTTEVNGDTLKIIVGDSKEGFIEALMLFLEVHSSHSYRTIKNVIINYNYVRPKGERLETFGGYASGHENMENMLHKIHQLFKARKHEGKRINLRRIDVMDIANIIGENVVSGGVRRTSEIMFIDIDDYETQNAKNELYMKNKDGEWIENTKLLHRQMSNNSIIYENKPTREQLHSHFEKMRWSGEPGIVNAEAAKRRRDNFKGLNPCAEILLDSKGVCNLTTTNLLAFVENGVLNRAALLRATELSARAGYRMTNVTLELENWDKIQKRDRLLGVSLTGYQEMVGETNMSKEEQIKLLADMREAAHRAMREIAAEIGGKESLLVTTVKPEGCWTKEFTRVTDNGILFIDEIEESADDEFGFHNVTKNITIRGNNVSKVYKNDIKDIFRITLKNGRVLRVSPSHPMSVNGRWVEAKDLKIGNILDYKLGVYDKTTETELVPLTPSQIEEYRSDMLDYSTPREMSKDLAWLIGSYYANGSFTTQDRIKFTSGYVEVHERVQKIWKKLFGVETKIVKSKNKEAYTQDFRSSKIRRWMLENGIHKYNDNGDMIIPKVIRTSSRESLLAFIVGYADNDGCFANKSFSIDTSQENFARHLQEVAETVGLSLGFSVNSQRSNSFSKKPMYKTHMSRAFSQPETIDFINSFSTRAQISGLLETGLIRSTNPYKIVAIEVEENQQTYDIEVEKEHWYYQGGLKSHNTLSQVFGGVSSGLHFPHAEYYIRRIRINAFDPLAKVAEELGWSIVAENGQEWETCKTKVIEFPMKSPAKKFKAEVGAIEQLETYKMFQEYYTDHNSSITVHVRPEEWGAVEDWIWENWDSFIGVSFLAFDDSFYQLLPYETVDKAKYEELLARTKPFEVSLLKKYETTGVSELDDETCAEGACAVR